MKRLIALGISIGVLAGLFTWFAGTVTSIGGWQTPFVVWVGFAAWACFYAAGGRRPGLVKTLASNASGVVWGWLIVQVVSHVAAGSAAVLGLLVALAAFGMCVQAAWGPLGFIPGAFVGAASFFGTGALFWSTVVSLIIGGLLAYVSEVLGDVIEKRLGASTVPVVEPPPVSAA
jgi:Protein of unknown function (DUF1097)